MPETMSVERRQILKVLGAELVLTEGPKGMKARSPSEELAKETPNSFIPQQFNNPANLRFIAARRPKKSGRHGRKVDVFVAGVARVARSRASAKSSRNAGLPSKSLRRAGRFAGPLRRSGRSAQDPGHWGGFVPGVYNSKTVDEVIRVKTPTPPRRRAGPQGRSILIGISAAPRSGRPSKSPAAMNRREKQSLWSFRTQESDISRRGYIKSPKSAVTTKPTKENMTMYVNRKGFKAVVAGLGVIVSLAGAGHAGVPLNNLEALEGSHSIL